MFKKIFLNNYVLIVVLILSMCLKACTDASESLHGTLTGDNFLQNEEQTDAVKGNAYTTLYSGYMGQYGFFGMQEASSDEAVVPQRGQDWFAGGTWIRLKKHATIPNETGAGGMGNNAWNFLYSGVNTCNRVLNQVKNLGKEGSEKDIAELRALRALYYYFLLDMFGNVPIVDKYDVPADFAPANNTRTEVYDFVESEIRNSLENLSKEVNQSTHSRMTYYAAEALLAKLYLNAKAYTGNPQWGKTVTAADKIINSDKFRLMDDYFKNFSADNSNVAESILAIPYDEVFAKGNGIGNFTLHYASQATFQLKSQPYNGIATTKEFYDMYEDEDIRKGNFLVGPQFTSTGEPLIDAGAEENDPDGKQINYTPKINELEPQALRQAGARIGKYKFATGADPGNLNNDVPIFRYADILLVKAEALWRMNHSDPEALRLVNLIRKRAGIDPFTVLTAKKILAERGREMFGELKRRQDMIRFGTYNDAFRFHEPDPDDHVNIFPIPADQLDTNPNLEQNPGY